MKKALTSICIIVAAGFIFSSSITLFEQGLQNLGVIAGPQAESSLFAYR